MPTDLTVEFDNNPPQTGAPEVDKIPHYTIESASRKLGVVGRNLKEGSAPDAQSIVALLTNAESLTVPGLDTHLEAMRAARKVGYYYRGNIPAAAALDEAIVRLADEDRLGLVTPLLSSSSKEVDVLDFVIDRNIGDPQKALLVREKIEKLWQKKRNDFTDKLTTRGADPELQGFILEKAVDPDSGLGVHEDFWQDFTTLPHTARKLLLESENITASSQMLTQLKQQGLLDYAEPAMGALNKISEPDQWAAYLNSLKKAMNAVEADKKITNPSRVVTTLSEFQDPHAALEGCKALFGEAEYADHLSRFAGLVRNNYGSGIISITEDQLQGLIAFKSYVDENDGTLEDLSTLVQERQKGGADAPPAERVVSGLTLAESIVKRDKSAYYAIAGNSNPEALAQAFISVEQLQKGKDDAFIRELYRKLDESNDAIAVAQQCNDAETALKKYGLDADRLGTKEFFSFSRDFLSRDEPVNDNKIERFCSDWKIKDQYKKAFEAYMQPVKETGEPSRADPGLRPDLLDVPELQRRFESIGIDQKLAEKIFASWDSYKALKSILYRANTHRAAINQVESAITEEVKALMKQVEGISKYHDTYGRGNLLSVIDTFGIYNFIRYTPEQLVSQLKRWREGEDMPKNILVTSHADWNSSADQAGKEYKNIFPEKEEGFYCFEVNDAHELAQVAKAIGQRERDNGRDPQITNSVKNFVIQSHASADGLLLGVNGERLKIEDYLFAQDVIVQNPDKIHSNNYRRDLGNQFRLILQACETAGESERFRETNIARAINEGHNVRVEGSTEATAGSIIFNKDGSITFRIKTKDGQTDKIPATTYLPKDE